MNCTTRTISTTNLDAQAAGQEPTVLQVHDDEAAQSAGLERRRRVLAPCDPSAVEADLNGAVQGGEGGAATGDGDRVKDASHGVEQVRVV